MSAHNKQFGKRKWRNISGSADLMTGFHEIFADCDGGILGDGMNRFNSATWSERARTHAHKRAHAHTHTHTESLSLAQIFADPDTLSFIADKIGNDGIYLLGLPILSDTTVAVRG